MNGSTNSTLIIALILRNSMMGKSYFKASGFISRSILGPTPYFWVNYNISLPWFVRPFGDDFPIHSPWFPGFGRTGLGRDEIFPVIFCRVNIHITHLSFPGTIWWRSNQLLSWAQKNKTPGHSTMRLTLGWDQSKRFRRKILTEKYAVIHMDLCGIIWNFYGDGSKPWYLVNPKIAGKWMFIPLKMYL